MPRLPPDGRGRVTADQREQALAAVGASAKDWRSDREKAGWCRCGRHATDPSPQCEWHRAVAAKLRAALTPPPLPADLAEIQARIDADAEQWAKFSGQLGPEEPSALRDRRALVAELAELRARPTLTAEEAAQALTWEGIVSANTTIPPHGHEAATVATLRAIAEGAGK